MKKLSFKINILYLILISLTPLIRSFGAIDAIGPQFLWLSFVNSIYVFPFFSYNRKILVSIPLLLLGFYLLLSLISFSYTSNLPESVIEFFRLLTLFLSLFFVSNVVYQLSDKSYKNFFIIQIFLIWSSRFSQL